MEGVCAEDDAAGERYLVAGEPVRIAAAIPALVRVANHARDRSHLGHRAQHALPDHGVLADDVPLVVVQRARLVQDLRRHRELADVMQLGGRRKTVELLVAEAEPRPDRLAQRHDVLRVRGGFAVARLERGNGHRERGPARRPVAVAVAVATVMSIAAVPAELVRHDDAVATRLLRGLKRGPALADRDERLHGSRRTAMPQETVIAGRVWFCAAIRSRMRSAISRPSSSSPGTSTTSSSSRYLNASRADGASSAATSAHLRSTASPTVRS